ncbi:MAG: hypothetical protein ACT4OK_22850 [Gemmobacter sp.]
MFKIAILVIIAILLVALFCLIWKGLGGPAHTDPHDLNPWD